VLNCVLKDPNRHFAVLKCARGGYWRAGLGFKNCELWPCEPIVDADHLGWRYPHHWQLAKEKRLFAETVLSRWICYLNADDDLVYDMRKSIKVTSALCSRMKKILESRHCQKLRWNHCDLPKRINITILPRPHGKCGLWEAKEIPLTYVERRPLWIQNIVTCSCLQGKRWEELVLKTWKAGHWTTFIPSATQTPGRLNFFKFKNFHRVLDYAHNPSGMVGIEEIYR